MAPGDFDDGAPRPKKQKTGGFKWKDKKPTDNDERKEPEGLHRGYRDRSPRRDSYRERSPRRDGETTIGKEEYRDRDVGSRENQYKPREDRSNDKEAKDGGDAGSKRSKTPREPADEEIALTQSAADKFGLPTAKSSKKDKTKKVSKIAAPSEPMIIVNVNDRLGTKASIPCLGSDSVKAFKAIVAAHIGRQPHEIMLKRQGERPFKDQLTLQDYGVSSGVQLDLEIDTGD